MPRKKKKPAKDRSSISIGDNFSGSLAVGSQNTQIGTIGSGATVVFAGESARVSVTFDARQQASLSRLATPDEIASLASAFRALDAKIDEEAAGKKHEARAQAEALKGAVAADKPDVSAMEKAKAWFVENLPALLGAVTSIFTHPLVGRLVEAAGEFTLDRFRARLGLPGA